MPPDAGKGKAAHLGTEGSLSSSRTQNQWQVGLAPPLCAVEAESQAGLQSVGIQRLGAMRSRSTLGPGSGGQGVRRHPGLGKVFAEPR